MLHSFFSSYILIETSANDTFSIPLFLLVALLSLSLLIHLVMFYKLKRVKKDKLEFQLNSMSQTEDTERQKTTLSTIYKSIPDIVFSKDINSIYTSCNPAFEKFTGYSEVNLIGKSDREIFNIDKNMADIFIKADQKVLRDECVDTMEEWVTYPDGSVFLFETLKTPMYQNGKVVGMLGIARDITMRKKAEEDAKIASKAKSAFLSHMSHEIRTPLNAIIGMSHIARVNINDIDKVTVSLDHVITASQHLLGVLNDILDISKIESGKMQLSKASNHIAIACNEINCIISERCDERGLHYVNNMNVPTEMLVVFDKIRLFQVLINLLANSVKFTDSGGTVVFSLDMVEETQTTATLSFSVSDNGIGMTQSQLEKLFIPFEQTDPSVSAKFGGTGLGLAISQSLIQMMAGNISVESTQGLGTTFKFELTFTKGCIDETVNLAPKLENIPNLEGLRILLVEDIEVNRIIVIEVLSETKAEIIEAVNGREAIKIFKELGDNYFSFILMDVQMPEIDGYEATHIIRSLGDGYAKNVPIIAMTANAYKEDVDAALKCGMNNHLAKPIDINMLYHILNSYQKKDMHQGT